MACGYPAIAGGQSPVVANSGCRAERPIQSPAVSYLFFTQNSCTGLKAHRSVDIPFTVQWLAKAFQAYLSA
jgi:hypothetical protein